eukprot:1106917-Prorocentrum_lima.AAC.1
MWVRPQQTRNQTSANLARPSDVGLRCTCIRYPAASIPSRSSQYINRTPSAMKLGGIVALALLLVAAPAVRRALAV